MINANEILLKNKVSSLLTIDNIVKPELKARYEEDSSDEEEYDDDDYGDDEEYDEPNPPDVVSSSSILRERSMS
jgi:hypothetical protein